MLCAARSTGRTKPGLSSRTVLLESRTVRITVETEFWVVLAQLCQREDSTVTDTLERLTRSSNGQDLPGVVRSYVTRHLLADATGRLVS